jgi:colanic acid biosynthesis glycosyl transferase WcaI
VKPRSFIVWGINYAPELTGIAPYNTALCEHLRAQSHKVRMVTSFAYYPEWRKSAQDRGRWFRTDRMNNVEVHRCWHYVPPKPSALKRMLHEFSFVATSWFRIMMLPRPDVYIVVSPPLLLGFAAWIASLMKRRPFCFHVQDLQPDAAVALGMIRPGRLLRALYALEAIAYKRAALVSGIIPGMTRAFADKGVPEKKIILFPNGIHLPPIEETFGLGAFRRRFHIAPEECLAVYSGNLGVKHGVEILLDAARALQGKSVRIVVCGDGARREILEATARERGLANVLFLPLQGEREYHEMLADADVYLVTQQAGSGALFFPSKLLKGLAYSKAVLAVADAQSELTRAAVDGQFARIVSPGDVDGLASALEFMAKNETERLRLGKAGRKYVEQFELKYLLRTFEARVCDFLNGEESGQPSEISLPSVSKSDAATLEQR